MSQSFIPSRILLTDDMANPTVPQVGAHVMTYDSVGGNWDRAQAVTLVDADTGAGTVIIPQVNIVQRASGGPVEAGISTNPLYVSLRNTATFVDGVAGSDWGPTYGFPYIYNALAGTWNRQIQAQLTYSSAGVGQVGLPAHVPYGMFDDTSPDLPAENTFHHVRITQYRAWHQNKRDASGNELQESTEATLLASAARTTTQTGADITNYSGFKYLHVVLDMTDVTAGPSVTLTIQGKDAASGKYYTILAGAAVTTVSTNVYRVGPGITPAANATTDYTLPRVWRILVTANNANSGTYSVGYALTK